MCNKNSVCIYATVERKLNRQKQETIKAPRQMCSISKTLYALAQLEGKSLPLYVNHLLQLQKGFQFSVLLCEGIYHFAARMEPSPFPHLTEL